MAREPLPPGPRYRFVQLLSLLLILGGLLALGSFLAAGSGLLPDGPAEPAGPERLRVVLVGGVIALVAGLVLNAVRSIIVRRRLPAHRYRGPSILVMLVLSAILATALSVPAVEDLLALEGGGTPTVGGSLLVLTATQLALVMVAAAFVFWPRALAGARFLPSGGVMRTVAFSLLVALPVWLGTQLVSVVITLLLQGLGMEFDPGLAEEAMASVNPVVLVLAFVVLAPIAEEAFFRGVVFNAWEREYGGRIALVGSAVVFAVIHGEVFALVPIFLLGLLLGYLYQRTRSLPAVITLHAAFNGVSLLLALLVRYEVIPVPT